MIMPEKPPVHRSQEDQLEALTAAMQDVARILPNLQRGPEDPQGNEYKRRNSDAFAFTKLVVPVLLALIMGFSGWMFSRVNNHADRLTVIENTRISPESREAMTAGIITLTTQMTEVQRRLLSMETELSALRAALNRRGGTP